MTGPQVVILLWFVIAIISSGATAIQNKELSSSSATMRIMSTLAAVVFLSCVLHWGGFW